jgi:hypothetical protein
VLGYRSGYEKAPERSGVTTYDPRRAAAGVNLVVSGHRPEATLMDMHGRVLHRWSSEAPASYGVPPQRNFWRRVELLDGGQLLAIFDPYGMIKLDKDSRLLWATDASDHIHHDLFVGADGLIHTLGRRYGKRPDLHERLTFAQDTIVVLDPAGRPLRRNAILDAFENSPFAAEMKQRIRASTAGVTGEVWEDFHANTIEVLDGSLAERSPVLKRGNIVSCTPHNNAVFIIDPDAVAVVWNWFGPWQRIHEPQITDRGRLLLFHNDGYHANRAAASQVLEYDLLTRQLVWAYQGRSEAPATRFFSGTSSTVRRLPNGNTLIVVTESGRAIEVTPDQDVVWEFFNPERAGEQRELIASLFQLERIPPARVQAWLGP